ncbi:MAG: S-methyl-5-thioribose-1-phosphate isomerase [Bacteroidales bacterium]|nr:S-methyl-5-thioribose-1-phosphate isomerase [Bacteroidales bacterium]
MQGKSVFMIDQNALPFEFRIYEAKDYRDTCHAIRSMITRGAGAIGAAAGFAMAQAFMEFWILDFGLIDFKTDLNANTDLISTSQNPENINREVYFEKCRQARREIEATRPTARNLFYATEKVFEAGLISPEAAYAEAQRLAAENVSDAMKIGEYGNSLIKEGSRILTHCNAGWLGFVDYGSALSPIYIAHREGKNIHVYADETLPRIQGARLTAWELFNEGVPHTLVPDNAGAYLMSKGMIDMVIVGADRIAANGDTANKIGTFEKAIIARQFGIPFYIAAPLSTFDLSIADGSQIIIEQREEDEVHFQQGPDEEGVIRRIRVSSPGSKAFNPAFDVTPAEWITGIITEKGIISPDALAIKRVIS